MKTNYESVPLSKGLSNAYKEELQNRLRVIKNIDNIRPSLLEAFYQAGGCPHALDEDIDELSLVEFLSILGANNIEFIYKGTRK